MKEAHDLFELRRLIAQLGLKDERRQSARYNVKIAGHYRAQLEKSAESSGKCWLVDVSKEGLSIKLDDGRMKEGTILYLELPMGGKMVGVSTKVVHVQLENGACTVGLKSTSDSDDIIRQLFSS